MQVQSPMALIDHTLKNMSVTLYDGWHWTDSTAKKRHQADLVMRVQSSMALLDNTLKNMSMTLYDRRH